VKTRSWFPYGRAEDDFSRFFVVRATTGLEIQAGVEPTRSFHTVCKNCAHKSALDKKGLHPARKMHHARWWAIASLYDIRC
jgi:hypothetical protein